MKNDFHVIITLIKRQRLILSVWIILFAAVYFFLVSITPIFYKFPILIFIYFFVAILLLYLTLPLFLGNRIKMINNILTVDCDSFPYINAYKDIIDQLGAMKKPPNLDYYRLSLCSGLAAAGRYNEAYEMLEKCKLSDNSRKGKILKTVYYNSLCSACIKLNRVDEAEKYLNHLIESMAALSAKDYNKYEKYLKLAQCGVDMEKGIFDNAENFYVEAFNKAVSNYERVGAKFHLGKVYLHFGDTARAKEAFEYVAAHGNKLYIVEEAKEYLK